MSEKRESDWDPLSEDVQRDQRAAYDEMRERCPVAYSDFMQWSLFRHKDVMRVLHDHETFSNAVSKHLNVPNGMDPPEHTEYRRIIEPYFSADRMRAFEPACRDIAVRLLRDALLKDEVELIADFALPFAAQVQCAFMGWPPSLYAPLIRWVQKSHQATLDQDRQAMAEMALEFGRFVDDLLEARLRTGAKPEDDLTAALMSEKVWGRPLTREEITSVLRNWTVGEIGTISASVGILADYLARHAEIQTRLRSQTSLLPAAIDEVLRIHGPLVGNRRAATCPVEIGGQKIDAGAHISINWIAANRDGGAFENPEDFRLDRDPASNLLYGAGIHVCPGAPLARMEMRVFMEELFLCSARIEPVPGKAPALAVYPASGYSELPLKILHAR